MRIETLSAPTSGTLLLDEVKDHLRLGSSDEDAALAALMRTAETMMENHLGAALVAREVRVYLDRFTASAATPDLWWQGTLEGPMSWAQGAASTLPLPVRPLIEVSKVEIWRADGWDEWPAANYSVSPGMTAFLHAADGAAWPTPARASGGIRITARIGFGEDWNAVPPAVRHALQQLVAWLYSHRGDEAAEDAMTASGAVALVAPYRKARL